MPGYFVNTGSPTSLTGSHTCSPTASHIGLFVTVAVTPLSSGNSFTGFTRTLTYAGVAMTSLGAVDCSASQSGWVELFYLGPTASSPTTQPAQGQNTLAFNVSSSVAAIYMESVSYSGVSQLTPGSFAAVSNTGTSCNVTVASSPTKFVVGGFACSGPILQQQVVSVGPATGGTFVQGFNGSTATIAFNASASAFETALWAMPTIGTGNVSVSGSNPWTLTFNGPLAAAAQNMMSIDGTNLTGGVPSVTSPGGFPLVLQNVSNTEAGNLLLMDGAGAASVTLTANTSLSRDWGAVACSVDAIATPALDHQSVIDGVISGISGASPGNSTAQLRSTVASQQATVATTTQQVGGLAGLSVASVNRALQQSSVGAGGTAGGTFVTDNFSSFANANNLSAAGFTGASGLIGISGGNAVWVPQSSVTQYSTAGSYTYTVPAFMASGDFFDIVMVGGGAGGPSGGLNAGGAGSWNAITLQYGVDIPLGTTSFTAVAGAGGPSQTPSGSAQPGGQSSVTITGYASSPITAAGGALGGSSSGVGASPGNEIFDTVTYTGGGTSNAGTSGSAPGGGAGVSGGSATAGAPGAVWITAYTNSGSPLATGSGASYYSTAATTTDYQVVSATLAAVNNGGELALIGRSNVLLTTYVIGYLQGGNAYLKAVVSGATTSFSSVAHTPIAGALYELILGNSTTANLYNIQLTCNGTALINYNDGGHVSTVGSSNRYAGLLMNQPSAGATPPSLSAWGVADNAPPATLGSGFRAYRTTTTSTSFTGSAAWLIFNTNKFPASGFDTVQFQTGDFTYTTSTNTLTVSIAGHYQVTIGTRIQAAGATDGGVGVFHNGTWVQAGPLTTWGTGATPILQGSFTVYCVANDTLTPGIYADGAGFTCLGEATGAATYWEVSLNNCGTLS